MLEHNQFRMDMMGYHSNWHHQALGAPFTNPEVSSLPGLPAAASAQQIQQAALAISAQQIQQTAALMVQSSTQATLARAAQLVQQLQGTHQVSINSSMEPAMLAMEPAMLAPADMTTLPPGANLRLAMEHGAVPTLGLSNLLTPHDTQHRQSSTKQTKALSEKVAHKLADLPGHNSLRNFLEEDLQKVDKRCVFTCRRINKLGFRSKEALHKFFSKYGEVKEVFVTHPRSKPEYPGLPPKVRPGNFGIVVMKKPEDVERILALGSDQIVKQIPIRVTKFEAKRDNSDEAKAEDSSGSTNGHEKSGNDTNGATSTEYSVSGATTSTRSGSDQCSPGDGNDSDEVTSNQASSILLQEPRSPKSTIFPQESQEPQKVSIESSADGNMRWKRLMRQEAERLRAEADAIMAVAEETDTLQSLPRGVLMSPARVASLLDSAGVEGIQQEALSPIGHTQPPLPPCEWLKAKLAQAQAPSLAVAPEPTTISTDLSVTKDSSCNGTLSSHLMEVSAEDPACVFVARQLHKLGFQSREMLLQHYSAYGRVQSVLVADKRVKAYQGSNNHRKTRPGGLGIVVMKDADSVQRILAIGREQFVSGHKVIIQPYEGPKMNAMKSDDLAQEDM